MTLATAAELAMLLTGIDSQVPQVLPELGKLSPREQELVIMVVQGRTNAEIAGSSTSACAPSAIVWTAFGTRPDVRAGPT
jgi:hypothetical protein